ncbi:MAG: hypothetical protein QM718_12445 [Steroidobacteraceae bacterium]
MVFDLFRAGAARAGGWLLLAGMLASAPSMAADCSRSCLLQLLNRYEAQVLRHDPSGLPLSADFREIHNNFPIKPGERYWTTLTKIVYQMQLADPLSGQTAAVGYAINDGKPAYFTLRLKVEGRKITQSEVFLVRDGEATFFGNDPKADFTAVYRASVPRAQRNTRAELVRAAEAFTESWSSRNEDDAPFADLGPHPQPCHFFENNVELTKEDSPSGPTCGGIVEYGGKNGIPGTGKAGRDQPPAAARAPGAPAAQPRRMLMRDTRNPIVDVEHGVVFGYTIQGGRVPQPGEAIEYERATPFMSESLHSGVPLPGAARQGAAQQGPPPQQQNGKEGGRPNPGAQGAAYICALYKIVGGRIVRVDHFEREGGPNAASAFKDSPAQ